MQAPEDLGAVPADLPFNPTDYVKAGFALVPIPRGEKGPRHLRWQLEENAIRTPEAAAGLVVCNIGLAHRWSGTCVLDIDDLQASTDWLAEWGVDLHELLAADDAVQIRSGRQGRAKLLYRLPESCDWLPTHKIDAVGLEFRCASKDGASTVQDVLPPSIHPDTNRPYEWAGAGDWRNPPTLPERVLAVWTEMAARAAKSVNAPAVVQSHASGGGGIVEGRRNDALASLAGTMRHRGLGQRAIEAALLVHNPDICRPPLPEEEVRGIAKSIAKYPAGLPTAHHAKTMQPGDEWPEPQSFALGVGESAPFPLDALPGIVGAAVAEYQEFGQQPLGLVASSALSVVSLVTQGLADVQRDRNLRGPLSLNFMVVAQSGERKTAADRAMGEPLSEWEQLRADLMAEDIAKNKAALSIHDAKVEGLKSSIRSAMKPSKRKVSVDLEQLRANLEDLELSRPKELVVPRLRYEDVNPQSLVAALATGHPSAALWSDEGGMVTGSHGMGSDSLLGYMTTLNRLWDGGSIRHDRKQTASLHVDGRRLTVSLMMQPAVLNELLHRAGGLSRGSGFLARFLVAAPASTMGTRFYREPVVGSPRMQSFHQRVRYLLDQSLPVDEVGRLQPPTLDLSPEAFAIWRTYHDDIERELCPQGEFSSVRDFAAKSAENAVRIAGCLHVFVEEGGVVQAETMERASHLAHWYLRESLRLMDALGEPQPWTDARLLDNWLASRGTCPARDVLREGPPQLREKVRRNAALNLLEELGRARRETHGNREMIVRNPQL